MHPEKKRILKFKIKKGYADLKYKLKVLMVHTIKMGYIALVFALTFKGVDILCSLL